jgi:hypothetical protein
LVRTQQHQLGFVLCAEKAQLTMNARKTTPEKPPKPSMLSNAGKGTQNPKALTPTQQRSIDARV